MHPIKEAGQEPKLNDIRHLRADQSMDWLTGCVGLNIVYRGTMQTSLSKRALLGGSRAVLSLPLEFGSLLFLIHVPQNVA